MSAPEILNDLFKSFAIVLHRLQLKRLAGRKRSVAECALAETMNGEDGGFVKTLARKLQSGQNPRIVPPLAL